MPACSAQRCSPAKNSRADRRSATPRASQSAQTSSPQKHLPPGGLRHPGEREFVPPAFIPQSTPGRRLDDHEPQRARQPAPSWSVSTSHPGTAYRDRLPSRGLLSTRIRQHATAHRKGKHLSQVVGMVLSPIPRTGTPENSMGLLSKQEKCNLLCDQHADTRSRLSLARSGKCPLPTVDLAAANSHNWSRPAKASRPTHPQTLADGPNRKLAIAARSLQYQSAIRPSHAVDARERGGTKGTLPCKPECLLSLYSLPV